MSATTRLSLLKRVGNAADQDAWCDFVAVYEPLLTGYVKSRCRGGGDDAVDEIVQTVFIKLFRAMPSFALNQQQGRFRTYLYRVTINAATDYFRKIRKDHPDGIVDPEPVAPDPGGDEDEVWKQNYKQAIFDRIAAQVRTEIEPVNPNKWRSFLQHCLNQRPAKEVADELGIAVSLVYQNTTRVLKTIKERCLELYDEALGGED